MNKDLSELVPDLGPEYRWKVKRIYRNHYDLLLQTKVMGVFWKTLGSSMIYHGDPKRTIPAAVQYIYKELKTSYELPKYV